MGPDWLGSPQHLVAGVALALAGSALARRRGAARGLALLLAVGLTAIAEIAVELVEYPLLYDGTTTVTAYWDTLADLAATMVGGLIGACVGVAGSGRRAAAPQAPGSRR